MNNIDLSSLQKERYNHLKGYRTYTQYIPILSICLLVFYMLVYIIRYSLWLYKQNRRKVRLLEYEKLRWLWNGKKKNNEKKELNNEKDSIDYPLPLCYKYHHQQQQQLLINDSNVTLNNNHYHSHSFISRPSSLPILKDYQSSLMESNFYHSPHLKKYHPSYYTNSLTTLSSITTLTPPPPSISSSLHHYLYDDNNNKFKNHYSFMDSKKNKNKNNNNKEKEEEEDDIQPILSPVHTDHTDLSLTTSSTSTSSSSNKNQFHHKVDQSGWSFYDTKSKRQQMKYQWSVAMGHCQYDHAKRLTSIINQLESS